MALVNDHVTDASEKKLGGEPGSADVARSTGSAQGRKHGQGGDLEFITKNNHIDAEYQLPVTADAKATWVSAAFGGGLALIAKYHASHTNIYVSARLTIVRKLASREGATVTTRHLSLALLSLPLFLLCFVQ